MTHMIIRKGNSKAQAKGTWWSHRTDQTNYIVHFACPNGHVGTLFWTKGKPERYHQIADDGTVSPSVVCDHPPDGCGFHQFIILEDWEPQRVE